MKLLSCTSCGIYEDETILYRYEEGDCYCKSCLWEELEYSGVISRWSCIDAAKAREARLGDELYSAWKDGDFEE